MIRNLHLLTVCALVAGSCGSQQEQEMLMIEPARFCLNEQLKKHTETLPVLERDIREQLTLPGKIEYNENDLVAFKSLVGGMVEKVSFELGDYVRQGQVLAVVKSNDVMELMQQKRSNENQLELLRKQIAVKKELLADGMASQTEVTEMEFELQSTQIEIDKIDATLKLFRAVGNGQFQILAPKPGYIVQKNLSAGQAIQPDADDRLFSISNLKQVWVMVNIYANNLRYVKQGDAVKLRTAAFPDQVYQGNIDKIYNVFDDDEHVIKARVVLDNPDLKLMPGLSVDVIIDKQNVLGSAFAIPGSAKIFENNKEYVVVYTDDCTLEIRRVATIAQNEEYAFVKETFAEGEQVVVQNALIIYEELNR